MRHFSRKFLFITAIAVLSLSRVCLAGEVYFNAAGAESVATTSCTTTNNTSSDTAGIGDHQYVTRDCSGTADQGFGWHFIYPTDAPTSGTPFTGYIYWMPSDTGTNNVVWKLELCCAGNATNYHDLTCGTSVSSAGIAAPGTATTMKISNIGALAPSSMTANSACFFRVTRPAVGDANDTYTSVSKVVAGRLNY